MAYRVRPRRGLSTHQPCRTARRRLLECRDAIEPDRSGSGATANSDSGEPSSSTDRRSDSSARPARASPGRSLADRLRARATRTRKVPSTVGSCEHHDGGPTLSNGGARALSRWGWSHLVLHRILPEWPARVRSTPPGRAYRGPYLGIEAPRCGVGGSPHRGASSNLRRRTTPGGRVRDRWPGRPPTSAARPVGHGGQGYGPDEEEPGPW